MIRFLFRRIALLVVTLWAVFTVTFLLMRSVPGGPFSSERQPPPEIREAIARRYRLDQPLAAQYAEELTRLIGGDLGMSFRLADYTVAEVIAEGWRATATLGAVSLCLAIVIGGAAGVVSAARPGSVIDVLVRSLSMAGIALPSFALAGLAVLVFVYRLRLLPAAGWGTLPQLVLPAACLSTVYAAEIARLVRSGLLEALESDWVRTARATGAGRGRLVVRHALRGAIGPVVSFLGPAVAGILTGSVVVEKVFAIPGIGSHFIDAATTRDYTLAMGLVLLYTLLLGLSGIVVDLLQAALDPRIELDR
ncbi:MAG: ABC transporter permease [Planctomycetaceae bacterium]